MKRRFFLSLLIVNSLWLTAFSQGIGIGTPAPHSSALLDLESSNKGLLVPRMSISQRDAIANPAKGLMVYVVDDSSFYFYHQAWRRLIPAEEVWSIKGNNGIDADQHFIGTTDNKPVRFKVNDTLRMQLDSNGRLQLYNPGDNLSIGYEAGLSTTTGTENYFMGHHSGTSNTTGQQNYFTGHVTGHLNTTGSRNFFNGFGAGNLNTTGSENYFSGYFAGFSNATAYSNHFTGYQAGYSNTTGSANYFSGYQAGLNNLSGWLNHFNGFSAGYSNTSGEYNHFCGQHAGYSNTTGLWNHFTGFQTGYHNTTGRDNYFSGFQAGGYNTTGSGNYFSGHSAGYNNTTGSNNTIIGYHADVTAGNLTNAGAIGNNARVSQNNSFVIGGTGVHAVNVGVGTTVPLARLDINSNADNSDIAIFRSTGGWGQIFVTQGTHTAELGSYPTGGYTGTNSAGDFRIRTGANDRMFFQHSTGNVGIGTNTPAHTLHVNGNAAANAFINLSDARLKKDILPLEDALSKILQFQGVSYYWNRELPSPFQFGANQQLGFLAQEVEKIVPDLVTTGTDGYKAVNYIEVIPLLVESIKDQQKQIDQLKILVNGLLNQNNNSR